MANYDFFGPASAPGAVTVRPADTRTVGATDTFFKDCTSPEADDGTEFHAEWFNQVLANLRALARANGTTAVGAVDIVTQSNADDSAILKAIQYLIQRGQPSYGDDTGTANHVVVALSPAPKEYKKGMVVVAKIAADNSGSTDINVNALGAVAVKHADGTDVAQRELLLGAMAAFAYDGTVFQLVWSQKQPGPTFLTAPKTLYVNATTGSDTLYDGTASAVSGTHGPFQSLKRASDEINKFNLNGFDVSVFVADGTYAYLPLPRPGGSGSIQWTGNAATPANVLINAVDRSAILSYGASNSINGFKVQTSGNPVTNGDPLYGAAASGGSSQLDLKNIEFGTCSGPQMYFQNAAGVKLHGSIKISGASTGNAFANGIFLQVVLNAQLTVDPSALPSLTISTPVTYAGAFISQSMASSVALYFSSITGAGNVTGKKYDITTNSILNSAGSGTSYFPGTVAGTTASGAQYV